MFTFEQLRLYEECLEYILQKENVWWALPRVAEQWWRRRDASEIKFDKNGEPYIRGLAAKDGAIRWIRLVSDKVIFEVEG